MSTLLNSNWWVPGLVLHEREAGNVLDESSGSLARRVGRPSWVDTVEDAVRSAGAPVADVLGDEARWRECFTVPLRSFVTGARDSLIEQAGHFLDPSNALLADIGESFAERLSRRLVRIAARVLAHEFNVAAADGRLAGDTGGQRLACFARMLAEPAHLARLIARYPVLGRLVGQVSRFAIDAQLELLRRFVDDRAAILEMLLHGVDPGPIVAIESGLGDAHRRGRTVTRLLFADGSQVVYKPRDLRSHEWFSAAVQWLNHMVPRLRLRAVSTLTRPGYGWLEFVPHRSLENREDAARFYVRQGALLALLHVAQATDIHYENIIANGDQPVLVDLETVFHATLSLPGTAIDPAGVALATSVQRTGLLPAAIVGSGSVLDMSGLGGERGQVSVSTAMDWEFSARGEMLPVRRTVEFGGAQNRPRLGSVELHAADYESSLLEGFRLGYDAIMLHQEQFTELVRAAADVEVRAVVRHTRGYATLISESTDPSVMRDALERDQMLDILRKESTHPLHQKVGRYEQADLWAHDIPLFSARPGSVDLWTSDDRRLSGMLDRAPLDSVVDKLGALSEENRRDQEWIISAALATRRATGEHDTTEPISGSLADTTASPDLLLAKACELADQIAARAIVDGNRVNWLGLELVEDQQWMVLPMGAGLANGYLGVALFLAQLAELSGRGQYAELARRAIQAIPTLYDTVATRPDLVTVIGCGGLHGFGGVAYGLARLATLLGDAEIRGWARDAVELATVAADSTDSPSWATGIAGCLATMTAVHAELKLGEAADLAGTCARRLHAMMSSERATSPRVAQGFADGVWGIDWALARYSATAGDHGSRARTALLAQNGVPSAPGWCSGGAGYFAARAGLCGGLLERTDRDVVVHLLTERPVLRDLSLCHGELGIVDTLIALTEIGEDAPPAAHRRRADLILAVVNQYGPTCGTPGAVSTPGLLSGLAGIGYGLLRLGFSEQVPSVLLLEPTSGLGSTTWH